MNAADRIAAAGRRVADRLVRLGRAAPASAEPEVTWHLHPKVARALEAATMHERPGAKEGQTRLVASVPGFAPFMVGEGDATVGILRGMFPKELRTPSQGQVAARFMADAQRQRVRDQRRAAKRSTGFVRNWGDL